MLITDKMFYPVKCVEIYRLIYYAAAAGSQGRGASRAPKPNQAGGMIFKDMGMMCAAGSTIVITKHRVDIGKLLYIFVFANAI